MEATHGGMTLPRRCGVDYGRLMPGKRKVIRCLMEGRYGHRSNARPRQRTCLDILRILRRSWPRAPPRSGFGGAQPAPVGHAPAGASPGMTPTRGGVRTIGNEKSL